MFAKHETFLSQRAKLHQNMAAGYRRLESICTALHLIPVSGQASLTEERWQDQIHHLMDAGVFRKDDSIVLESHIGESIWTIAVVRVRDDGSYVAATERIMGYDMDNHELLAVCREAIRLLPTPIVCLPISN